jgi:histidinol-phosphate aminotransferase
MTGPRYPDLIARLPETVPFVGPEVQERALGRPFRARIGANESVFGPSPAAIAAMREAAAEVWKYADPSSHELKETLSARLGCGPANIVFGEGIDGLLGYTVRLLVEPGDTVVTSAGAYPTFNYHVTGFGGQLHMVPYRDDAEDIDALIGRAAEVGAKLIYLSNPDNPMGSWHSGATIEAALNALPPGCVLALDEAYIEFAPAGTAPRIDIEDPRVIRFRTFSKGYGMAGARVGYAFGAAPLIRAFDKVRNHFAMNRVAQVGTQEALLDEAWLHQVVARTAAGRDRIAAIALANGLTPLPSATNFVAIDCGRDGTYARTVLDALVARGVFVRMPGVAPLDRCIRVTAGTDADLDVLESVLPEALDAAKTGAARAG